LTETKQKYN